MLAIFIFIIFFESVIADKNPVVQTSYGKVRGTALETYNGNVFYAFQGIPFAEPPVGNLRFQAPQPPKKWKGVLEMENVNKKCIQISTGFMPGESEDCLYLNVYTPELPARQQLAPLPVLVYIHGGGFVAGAGSINALRPHKLMDTGVVMVALQYRLGLLGFLSTGDLECPGNNGFKDQQLALKWIQNNIRNFGGDPSKVTISGQSAGSGSVGYQLLGSNAEGLFRGVIQASGSSLGAWTLQRDPKYIAVQVARYIDPTISENITSQELMAFYRAVDVSKIKEACVATFGEGIIANIYKTGMGFVFSGTIEPEHDGAFLTETAYKKFETGNFNVVPTLLGVTSEECIFLSTDEQFQERLSRMDASPELIVSPNMHIGDLNVKRQVGSYIREMYVGGGGLLHENIGPSIKYYSEFMFVIPSIKQAQLTSKYTDVYFYEFGYAGELGRIDDRVHIPGAETVRHEEDIKYIFVPSRKEVQKHADSDIITMERMVLIWTNFVKYLNPSPEPSDLLQNVTWTKVPANGQFPHLLINETIELKYDYRKPVIDGYQLLYDTYAVPPLDTY